MCSRRSDGNLDFAEKSLQFVGTGTRYDIAERPQRSLIVHSPVLKDEASGPAFQPAGETVNPDVAEAIRAGRTG